MHIVTKLFLSALLFTLLHVGAADAQTVDTAVARQLLAAKDTVAKPTIKNPAFKETDSSKLADPRARIPGKLLYDLLYYQAGGRFITGRYGRCP
ncbi:hypothetical protein KRR40_23825 [Niabella defluvii]|nr:hypothetical protein KRR40_23825 [Niabella sp. I65]